MAEKPSDEKRRARALLSEGALPKIEIPRSGERQHREFKLPDKLHNPVPSRPKKATDGAGKPNRRRRGSSTGRFRDRTQGWFKKGEELEEGEGELEPPKRGHAGLFAAIGGGALVAVLVLIWWLR